MQTNRVDYVDRTLSAPLTRRSLMAAALGVGAVTVSGCSDHGGSPREPVTGSPGSPSGSTTVPSGTPSGPPTREQIIKEFGSRQPEAWGIDVPGVALTLPAGTRAIALTFDCCGGRGGDTLDEALVQTLRDNGTPATFFLSGRWVKSNPEATEQLASDSLFEIANHGTHHQPLSVSGASAYGIPGTHDVGAVYDEVMGAQELIKERTGITPKYFRSGTAHLDDVSGEIVRSLELLAVNFNRNGDEGGTMAAPAVTHRLMGLEPGDIFLAHANRPSSGTATGVAAALPALRERGVNFAGLSEVLPL